MTGNTIVRMAGGFVLGAALALAPAAHAQTQPKPRPAAKPAAAPKPTATQAPQGIAGIGQGDSEFSVFGNYTSYDDVDSDLLLVGAAFGTFVSDTMQVRIAPSISFQDGGGSTTFTFAPFFSFEFLFRGRARTNPVVPFVGGGIGLTFGYTDSDLGGDSSTVGVGVGPTGGMRLFLTERMSVELSLTYQFLIVSICGDVDCFSGDMNTLVQNVRLNFYY